MRGGRPVILALAALAIGAAAPACHRNPGSSVTGDETVLQIGDRVITLREFCDQFDRAKLERGIAGDPAAATALKSQLVAETIKRELLLRYAREKGMTIGAEEVAGEIGKIRAHYPGDSFREMLAEQYVAYDEWIERQKTRLLEEKVVTEELENKVTVSEEEAKSWLAQHPDLAEEPERVRLQQILVGSEDEAKLVKARLSGGGDFATLAKEKSISPEGKEGGDLGVFARSEIPAGMELVFRLKTGEASEVVQSEYGFHIFRVTEHSPARVLPFEEVKPKVIAAVKAAKVAQAFPAWLTQLSDGMKVKVTRNDALLAAIE